MEEYPARFAELLEQIAIKVRSITVDPLARAIRVAGLGILAATLGLTALLFLLFAIFGALEIPLTTAGALALVGVLLTGAGTYLWMKRV
jgi:drug/metabolite transporter (DMT)-like permease